MSSSTVMKLLVVVEFLLRQQYYEDDHPRQFNCVLQLRLIVNFPLPLVPSPLNQVHTVRVPHNVPRLGPASDTDSLGCVHLESNLCELKLQRLSHRKGAIPRHRNLSKQQTQQVLCPELCRASVSINWDLENWPPLTA